ncbi:tRNA adenosine(34) deaminase TadA [Candidatus Spongiihabitans sp.]|uniref:tRNA adenosine(34) deaminase TadA n=1 Tax=Candidatus Spongiihabitans sp. TaxID=3101308 RepID=UPI003C6FC589
MTSSGLTRCQLHHQFMARALELAIMAQDSDEIPVGAVVAQNEKIIGEGFNCSIGNHDASGHAEILALRAAGKNIENYRLDKCSLYVTMEPCIMCAGAILHARIKHLIFATHDLKFGAAGSQLNLLQSRFLNHRCSITAGIMQRECQELIQQFFKQKRHQ